MSVYNCDAYLNTYINIVHTIVNCKLGVPHTKLPTGAYYLDEEINNHTIQY